MRQALWLTKTKLIPNLPPQLLSLADNPANQIQDQDERVQNAIKHARFWDTTVARPDKLKYRYFKQNVRRCTDVCEQIYNIWNVQFVKRVLKEDHDVFVKIYSASFDFFFFFRLKKVCF